MNPTPPKKKARKSTAKLELLEPRVLFSADMLPGFAEDAGIAQTGMSVSGEDLFPGLADEHIGASPVSAGAATLDVVHNVNTLVAQDGAVPITNSQLSTTVITSSAEDIIYTITSAPSEGRVSFFSAPWTAVTTFTQQDIDDGQLFYVNTSGGVSDSFFFTVSDGVETLNDEFTFELSAPSPITLSSGIEINLDGGNDAYLRSEPLGVTGVSAATVEVMFAGVSEGEHTPLFAVENSQTTEVSIGIDNSSGVLEISIGGDEASLTDRNYKAMLLDGTVHSVALTWSEAQGAWALFADGLPMGSGDGLSEAAPFDFSVAEVLLGQYDAVGGTDSYFRGNYYDLRIWDHVRSEPEIMHMADRKLDWSDPGLIANWQMEPIASVIEIEDRVSNNLLSAAYVVGSGFAAEVRHDLNVDENSPAGTHVGYVIPHDSEATRFVEADGDFTLAGDPGGTTRYMDGPLGGWTVSGGTVDHLQADGVFSDKTLLGGDSLRLTDAGVSVGQTMPTEAGRLYQLSYSVAADFSASTDEATIEVIAGNLLETETLSMSPDWSLEDNMGWRYGSVIFVADSATTELSFTSILPNGVIADVRVVELSDEVTSVLADQRSMSYDPITNKFYKLIDSHRTTIANAQTTAILQTVYGVSSRLVTVHSAYENARVNSLTKDLTDVIWMGADDAASEGEWQWTLAENFKKDFWSGDYSGAPVNDAYNNWRSPTEPNDYNGGEDYAVMDASGIWSDEPSLTGLNYAIYEWDVSEVENAYSFDEIFSNDFSVDAATGEIVVSSMADIDFEQTSNLTVAVTVHDERSQSGTYLGTVWVDNVNEAPSGTDGVNTPPQGADTSLQIREDQPYNFSELDFGYTDADGDAFDFISVEVLPVNGLLTLNGQAVAVGDAISTGLLTGLTFTPDANAHGDAYAELMFTVGDDGGVANGGNNVSVVPNTIAIRVLAVNDAPSGANGDVYLLEDESYLFSGNEFGFSDVDADQFAALEIVSVPAAGLLTLSGSVVVDGQIVSGGDISSLTFTPISNEFGVNYSSLSFKVRDNGGTVNSGVDTDPVANTIMLHVGSVNDAPFGTDGEITVNEYSSYQFGAADFGFGDIEANNFATVKILSLPDTGTLLQAGVGVSPGQIISAGALSGLVYQLDSRNDSSSTEFDFQVQDNGGTSDGGIDTDPAGNSIKINLSEVSLAPSGEDKTLVIDEDSSYWFSTTDFGFSDIDQNEFTAVEISSVPTTGALLLSGAQVSAGQVIDISVIENLAFTPAANDNGEQYADFTFRVKDDGSTSNGGANIDLVANTVSINVNPVNDRPLGVDRVVNTPEDVMYQFTAADFDFIDVESDALAAVTITSLPVNGRLELSGAAVYQGQELAASQITELTFTPALNQFGVDYDAIAFVVRDSGGIQHGGEDTDNTENTLFITVSEVNDAPAGSDFSVSVGEDSVFNFSAQDFGFNDIDNNELNAIQITSLPVSGVLTLDGSSVTSGDTVTADKLGLLSYSPDADEHGQNYADFTFRVQDNGGRLNGGVDTDYQMRTATINVEAINDAPGGKDNTIVTSEDNSYQFAASDFGFNDPDGHRLAFVEIDTLPTKGELSLYGVPLNVAQSISADALSALEYSPVLNESGIAYSSFTFRVQDDGGVLNGGTDTDAVVNLITANVSSVNDAPFGKDKLISIVEDGQYQFSATDFGFSDSDQDALSSVTIINPPAKGELLLLGLPVTSGTTVAAANIEDLKYKPGSDGNGISYADFSFVVSDDGGSANGGSNTDEQANKITFDVASVSDSPQGQDGVIHLNEDSVASFTAADFGFNDIDGDNFTAIIIESLPEHGTLSLSGVAVTAPLQVSMLELENLLYEPAPNAYGKPYAELAFRVVDDGNDGSMGASISEAVNTASLIVDSVNDAPVGEDGGIDLLEDTDYVFSPADFGYTDLENDDFLGIIIDKLPGSGSLLYNNSSPEPGEIVLAADIEAGNFQFTPVANDTGLVPFEYRVIDAGGVERDGEDTDQTSRTLTFDVQSVNDPPMAVGSDLLLREGEARVLTATDFSYSDEVESDQFSAVVVTELPALGELLLNNSGVVNGQTISAADIQSGSLVYVAATNVEDYQAALLFHAMDNGGTENSGSDLSVEPAQVTFIVDAVNEAPSLSVTGASVDEGNSVVISTLELFATDADDQESQLTVTVVEPPLYGELTFDGQVLGEGDSFTAAELHSDRVRYLHDGSETNADSVLISVADGGEDGALPVVGSLLFTIVEVIDAAPAVSNDRVELSALEVGEAAKSEGAIEIQYDLLGNDLAGKANDASQLTLTIHTQATNGTVLLNDDGTFSYFPLTADVTKDQFSYKLANADGVSSVATVDLFVEPVIAEANDLMAFQTEPLMPQMVETEVSLEEPIEVQQAAVTNEQEAVEEKSSGLGEASAQGVLESAVEFFEREDSVQDMLPAVVEREQFRIDSNTDDSANEGLEKIAVRQHNRVSTIDLNTEQTSLSVSSFKIELDVVKIDARATVDNRSFQRGLGQIDNLLEQSESEHNKRVSIGSDTAFGVSVSVSAGALAWLLRGGSLVASMVAVTPLWSSIDPLKIANKALKNSDDEGDVERIFDK